MKNKPRLEARVLALEVLVTHLAAGQAKTRPEYLAGLGVMMETLSRKLALYPLEPQVREDIHLALRELLTSTRGLLDNLD